MDNPFSLTTILLAIIFIAIVFIYLMYVRIKQLEKELHDLKNRVSVTDEELTRLTKDIEDFKKINI